jgi:hypothetical protein
LDSKEEQETVTKKVKINKKKEVQGTEGEQMRKLM